MFGVFRRLAYEFFSLRRTLDGDCFRRWLWAVTTSAPQIILSRRLEPADRKVRGRIVFRTWGTSVVLNVTEIDEALRFDPSSAFGLARELYGRNVYLRAFKRFSASGMTAVDLGGNRGFFSLLAFAAFDAHKVIYVEPDERYETIARQLSRLEGTERHLEVIRGFVGSRPDGASAPLIELDELVSRESHIAFLKADIEGAEELLFRRENLWLGKVHRLAMEAHPKIADMERVTNELRSAGFSVYSADATGVPTQPRLAHYIYGARDPAAFSRRFQRP